MKRLRRGELARISRETGLDPSYLSSISSGNKEPGVNNFAKIARAMGESADDLLGLERRDPSRPSVAERAAVARAERAEKRMAKALSLLAPEPNTSAPRKPQP